MHELVFSLSIFMFNIYIFLDELFEAHNEQPLTTTSTVQLKNRLKRSLLNEPSSYDKISKVRVTKNSDDELEVIQLNVNSCTLSNKHHELNEVRKSLYIFTHTICQGVIRVWDL